MTHPLAHLVTQGAAVHPLDHLIKDEPGVSAKREAHPLAHLLKTGTEDVTTQTAVPEPGYWSDVASNLVREAQELGSAAQALATGPGKEFVQSPATMILRQILKAPQQAAALPGDIAANAMIEEGSITDRIGKRGKQILSHPAQTFRDEPLSTGLDVSIALGLARKPAEIAARALVPKAAKRGLAPLHGMSDDMVKAYRRMRGEKAAGQRAAKELAETEVGEFTKAERVRLGQLRKGGVAAATAEAELRAETAERVTAEINRMTPVLREYKMLPEETYTTKLSKKRLHSLRTERDQLIATVNKIEKKHGKTVAGKLPEVKHAKARIIEIAGDSQTGELGIIKTSYKMGGTNYMRRMYTKHLGRNARAWLKKEGYNTNRLDMTYAIRRENIPAAIRKEMGEILEPALPDFVALTKGYHDIALGKWYREIAQSRWASGTPKEGFELVTAGKVAGARTPLTQLGELEGMYVHTPVAREINAMNEYLKAHQKVYRRTMSYWKSFMVLSRPFTYARNIGANEPFFYWATGESAVGPKGFLRTRTAIHAYKAKAAEYSKWEKAGLFGTEYYGTEIELMARDFKVVTSSEEGWMRYALRLPKRSVDKAIDIGGRFYNAADEIHKMRLAQYAESTLGMSADDSVNFAFKWAQNYRDIGPWLKTLRQHPTPFIAFPAEFARIAHNAWREHPIRFMGTLAAPLVYEHGWRMYNGLTQEEYEAMKKGLPDYYRVPEGWAAPVGGYDPENPEQTRFVNLAWWLPWGAAMQWATDPTRELLSNPFYTTAAEILDSEHKDTFTGYPIVKQAEPSLTERVGAWTTHLKNKFLPALPVGRDADILRRNINLYRKLPPGDKDRPDLFYDILGREFIGTTKTPDIKKYKGIAISKKQKRLKALQAELIRTLLSPDTRALSPEERQKKIKGIIQKIRKVAKEPLIE